MLSPVPRVEILTSTSRENQRVIIRKHERISIPPGAVGVPVGQFFGDKVKLPETLAGALVYEIDGCAIIAMQDKTAHE